MEELFQILQALSPTEKRYLKLNSGRNFEGEADAYLALFDWILENAPLDKNHLKDQVRVLFKNGQVNYHIHYLKAMVLQSMERYEGGKSIPSQIRHLLGQIEWLFGKELHASGLKKVEQALGLAQTHDLQYEMAVLLRWKRRLLLRIPNADLENELAETELAEQQNSDFLATEQQLQAIHDRLLALSRAERRIPLNRLRPMTRKIRGQLARLERKGIESFQGKSLWYTIQGVLSLMEANKEKIHHWHKLLLDHWYRNPHQIKQQEARFLATVIAYLNSGAITGQVENLLQTLWTIRQNPDLGKKIRQTLAWHQSNIEILHHINQQNISQASLAARQLENLLAIRQPPEKLAATLFFNAGTATFFNGQFAQALTWLQRTRQNTSLQHRIDLYIAASTLAAACLYETAQLEESLRLLKDMQRKLKVHSQIRPLETALLSALEKSIKKALPGEESLIFKQLTDEFLEQFSKAKSPRPGQVQIFSYVTFKANGGSLEQAFKDCAALTPWNSG